MKVKILREYNNRHKKCVVKRVNLWRDGMEKVIEDAVMTFTEREGEDGKRIGDRPGPGKSCRTMEVTAKKGGRASTKGTTE